MEIDTIFDFVLIGHNMIPNALNYSVLGIDYILEEDNDNSDGFILRTDNENNDYQSTLGCDEMDNGLGINLNYPNISYQDYGIELQGDGSENNNPQLHLLDLYNF